MHVNIISKSCSRNEDEVQVVAVYVIRHKSTKIDHVLAGEKSEGKTLLQRAPKQRSSSLMAPMALVSFPPGLIAKVGSRGRGRRRLAGAAQTQVSLAGACPWEQSTYPPSI